MISAFLVGFTLIQQSIAMFNGIDTIVVSGEVTRGQLFSCIVHDSLIFKLVPNEYGWTISISTLTRLNEDISKLTPPFHFAPNPRDIEGWHFRNISNAGPNDGSVNAPDSIRDFIFSSKVGITFFYPVSEDQIEQIKKDGYGTLTIEDLELDNLIPNERACIKRMRFNVRMFINF